MKKYIFRGFLLLIKLFLLSLTSCSSPVNNHSQESSSLNGLSSNANNREISGDKVIDFSGTSHIFKNGAVSFYEKNGNYVQLDHKKKLWFGTWEAKRFNELCTRLDMEKRKIEYCGKLERKKSQPENLLFYIGELNIPPRKIVRGDIANLERKIYNKKYAIKEQKLINKNTDLITHKIIKDKSFKYIIYAKPRNAYTLVRPSLFSTSGFSISNDKEIYIESCNTMYEGQLEPLQLRSRKTFSKITMDDGKCAIGIVTDGSSYLRHYNIKISPEKVAESYRKYRGTHPWALPSWVGGLVRDGQKYKASPQYKIDQCKQSCQSEAKKIKDSQCKYRSNKMRSLMLLFPTSDRIECRNAVNKAEKQCKRECDSN